MSQAPAAVLDLSTGRPLYGRENIGVKLMCECVRVSE